MAIDALNRNESCGGHFRRPLNSEEKQKEMTKITNTLQLGNTKVRYQCRSMHKEELMYENIEVKTRSYK
jgi:succinate dehydrogenase / fumarate reductase flavoprotein subunit